MTPIKILFFGDIFGKIGRQGLKKILPKLKEQYQPDLILANAENLAHGHGITEPTITEMIEAGIDIFTSGNHIWDKNDAYAILNKKNSPVIRPANYPEGTAGQGEKLFKVGLNTILVVNLMGRVFFRENFDDPFRIIDKVLAEHSQEKLAGIIIDFHAEATSEKKALGYYLDGRVSAIIGSHTHVQTADEIILDKGTAYLSDIGMVGAKDSVIGLEKKQVIQNFLSQVGLSAEVPETGACQINAVYLEIDPKTQRAKKIERIMTEVEI